MQLVASINEINKAIDKKYHEKPNGENEKALFLSLTYNMKAEKYCNIALTPVTEGTHENIKSTFASNKDYLKLCIMLRNTPDCNNFHIETKGVWSIIKESVNYGLMIMDCYDCISNLLKIGGKDSATETPENTKVKNLSERIFGAWNLTSMFLSQIGHTALHILTFGIWGTIRSIYYVTELALELISFYEDVQDDLTFNLGKLMGQSAYILKTLIFGKKRRK